MEKYSIGKDSSKEAIAGQVPALMSLLLEIHSNSAEVIKHVKALKEHVSTERFSTEKGISLLEVKQNLLLSYLIDLVQLMVHKIEGRQICEDVCTDRLVEIRTVIEKIRPLDLKLKYQIDKLLQTANGGIPTIADPLQCKPNPGNLISKLPVVHDDKDFLQSDATVYVPPKVHAVPYVDKKDHKVVSKGIRKMMAKEIRDLSDAPQEEKFNGDNKADLNLEEMKEKERYEEEYFVRLDSNRKRSKSSVHHRSTGTLNDLLGIDKVSRKKGRASFKLKRGKFKGKKRSVQH